MGIKERIQKSRVGLRLLRSVALWLVFPVTLLSFVMFHPGLPGDEEMIAHFYKHRADIEELVARYRRFVPKDNGFYSDWSKQTNTSDIMKRAEVNFIGFSARALWLPNPYSLDSGEKVYEMLNSDKEENLYDFEHYGELLIKLSPRERYRTTNLYYGVIWKWIVYFPENPRIERGKIIFPTDWDGETSYVERVENSLNILPYKWRVYGCAYRKIEDYWFLRICNGH